MAQGGAVWAGGRLAVVALMVAVALCIPAAATADPGDLDPTFDGDGVVVTELVPALDADSGWRSIAVDSQSRVVAAGWTDPAGIPSTKDFVVARYLSTGVLDPSFGGGDGYALIDVLDLDEDDRAEAVVLDGLGRIYVGGRARDLDDFRFAAVRLLSDGSIDAGYGGLEGDPPGVASTNVHPDQKDGINALTLDAEGRLVAAGTQGATSAGDFALARYTLAGDEDDSFGVDGDVLANFGPYEEAEDVALDSQGRIVAAGWTSNSAGGSPDDMAVARFTAGGAPDPAFNGSGQRVIDFAAAGEIDAAFSLALADGDAILLAGPSVGPGGSDFAVAKLTSSGADDPSFGAGDGRAAIRVQTGSQASEIVLDAADRILLSGVSSDGDRFSYAAARLLGDGSIDPTFSADGSATAQLQGSDLAYAAALDPLTGRLVVGGLTQNQGGEVDFGLARFASFEAPAEASRCRSRTATIAGTDGRDKLKGTAGADVIYAGAGKDRVRAKAGKDIVCGGRGKDTLKGQGARDTLLGQRGRDRLRGGGGRDKLRGGPGRDSVKQ